MGPRTSSTPPPPRGPETRGHAGSPRVCGTGTPRGGARRRDLSDMRKESPRGFGPSPRRGHGAEEVRDAPSPPSDPVAAGGPPSPRFNEKLSLSLRLRSTRRLLC